MELTHNELFAVLLTALIGLVIFIFKKTDNTAQSAIELTNNHYDANKCEIMAIKERIRIIEYRLDNCACYGKNEDHK